jgi:hypothetical protein
MGQDPADADHQGLLGGDQPGRHAHAAERSREEVRALGAADDRDRSGLSNRASAPLISSPVRRPEM